MAKVVVQELVARFSGDTKQLEAATGRAQKALNAFKLAAAAATAAIAATATAALVLGRNQAKLIDSTAKVADKLGIATDQLQALRLAAEDSGVSTNTLDMALQRMVRRIAEAAQGTGEAKDALIQLGLNAKELSQGSPDEAFRKIAAAMSEVEGQGEKVRLAFKLFDSEGVALVNTLKLGEEALRDYQVEAERLGIAFSRVDAQKVEDANDAFNRVGKTVEGVGNLIAIEFAPLITILSEEFVAAATDGEIMGDSISASMQVAASIIDAVRKTVLVFRWTFEQAILAIQVGAQNAAGYLIEFSEAAAGMFQLVGIDREASPAIKRLGKTIQDSAKQTAISIREIEKEILNFESTAIKIERTNKRSAERASGKGASLGGITFNGDAIKKEADTASRAIETTTSKVKELGRASRVSIAGEVDQSFDIFNSGLIASIDSLESLKSTALRVFEDIAQSIASLALGGGSGGGFGGAIASAIGGAFNFGSAGFAARSGASSAGIIRAGANPNLFGPGFATGGRMTVGGTGGTDSQMVAFRATPNERITVEKPGQNLGGGGNVNVTVINNSSAKAEVQEQQTPNGKDITVLIDEITAGNIGSRSSKTNAAFRAMQSQGLARR